MEISHILVARAPVGDAAAIAKARARAQAALDRIRAAGGANFAQVAAEASEDKATAKSGGKVPVPIRREARERIRKAFQALPPKYRLVATLALIEEEPYNNIAEAAGMSVALVKVRVFRAVRMLRKKLNSLGVEVNAK